MVRRREALAEVLVRFVNRRISYFVKFFLIGKAIKNHGDF